MAEIREVLVPDIGDFADVPVIEVLVSPGDTVAPEDPLVTLESDKATMDVPAPFGGTVAEIRVSVGDTVSEGSPILDAARSQAQRRAADAGAGRRRPQPPVETPRRPTRPCPPSPQAAPAAGRGRRAGPYAQPGGAPPRARAGRRPERGRGLRPQGPDHQGGRARRRRGARRQPAAADRCAGHRAWTSRRGRRSTSRSTARSSAGRCSRIAEDQRPEPGPQLGDDPARHPPRRGGHHRARGVSQARSTRSTPSRA